MLTAISVYLRNACWVLIACIFTSLAIVVFGAGTSVLGQTGGNRVARWDAQSHTWQPLGTGMNDDVFDLTVWNDKLIAAGSFWRAGGVDVSGVASWDTLGETWQPLGTGVSAWDPYATVPNSFRALSGYGEVLFAGGILSPRWFSICRWDGLTWDSLAADQGWTYSLSVYENELIAGGFKYYSNLLGYQYIARWDGSHWDTLGSGVDDSVLALTVYGNALIAAGGFDKAGGLAASKIAQWDGFSWSPLGTGLAGTVSALIVYDGVLVAAGDSAGAGYVAQWDGAAWQMLGSGFNDFVGALSVYDGDLIAGGGFDTADGMVVNHIARWNGVNWDSLGAGLGDVVLCLTVYNNELIAGGKFLASQAGIFGNGSDQDLTVTGYWNDLDRDMLYNNLTIDSGGYFSTNGYTIRVAGTLLNNGTITDDVSGGEGGYGGYGGDGGHDIAFPLVHDHTPPEDGKPGEWGKQPLKEGGGTGGAGGGGGGGGGGAWDMTLDARGGNDYGDFYHEDGMGGNGGKGGGVVTIYARVLDNRGVIHADGFPGENGKDGEDGQYLMTLGPEGGLMDGAGGGGGGGAAGNGGDGGTVEVFYSAGVSPGEITAHGGTAGSGGSGGSGHWVSIGALLGNDEDGAAGACTDYYECGGSGGGGSRIPVTSSEDGHDGDDGLPGDAGTVMITQTMVCYCDDDNDGYGDAGHAGIDVVGSCDIGYVDNSLDNCPNVYNPDQLDSDGDGLGDLCDGCCVGIRGNVDGSSNDVIDIIDLTFLVAYMFKNGDAPTCLEEADVNALPAQVDILDLTYLVAYMFKSGPDPVGCP